MTTKKLIATVLGALLVFTPVTGLAGCSGESDSPAASQAATADVDVAADLTAARDVVTQALEYGEWDQVMLASDVDGPTQKYGLMVMPFIKSDASERVSGTVAISDGDQFVIEAVSAATGKTWQIDQDGKISEVQG